MTFKSVPRPLGSGPCEPLPNGRGTVNVSLQAAQDIRSRKSCLLPSLTLRGCEFLPRGLAPRNLGAISIGLKEIHSQPDGSVIRVRVKPAQRDQIQWRDASGDQLVPQDQRVRAVWAYVDSLDLTALYAKIRAVEGASGGTRSNNGAATSPLR